MRLRIGRLEIRLIPRRPPLKHGTRSGYERGCRCGPCVETRRRYQRAYMRRKRAEGSPAGIRQRNTEEVE